MPSLNRITIFPIKALDGVDVPSARVLTSGALEHDRRWAIVDGQGRFLNGKRTPAIHQIRAAFEIPLPRREGLGEGFATSLTATLKAGNSSATFNLPADAEALAAWLSDLFGVRCRLIENPSGGFPDDGDAAGPTIISTASLAAAAAWFDGLDVDEMRRRIRANLELDAAEPFWEDRLADDGSGRRRFAFGDTTFRGRTICMRCIVPTRCSQMGAGDAGFAREFATRRQASLPAWSPVEQFDHFYRLAINTSPDWIPDGATLRVGDEVVVK